ncbi:unnamed protein product, partial [marine sediment metagenome]
QQVRGGFSPFDLIMHFYRLTPEGVTLSRLSIDRDRGISMHGQARALSQVFDYLSILEKSELFSKIEPRYAEKRPVGDKEIVDFEMFLIPASSKR